MGSINIVELWNSMGGIAKGVVVIWASCRPISISVMIERWITYRLPASSPECSPPLWPSA